MRRQGEEKQTVALKVCRTELDSHNAIPIMEEVQLLRYVILAFRPQPRASCMQELVELRLEMGLSGIIS